MQMMKKIVGGVNSVIGWIYLAVIAGILPFYYTQGYGYIGSDKARFFKTLGFPLLIAGFAGLVIYLALSLAGLLKEKKGKEIWQWIKGELSVTDMFALCYALVLIISYLSTPYKETAWYGYEKWPNGLLPHLMVVISYFLLSRFMLGHEYFIGLVRKVAAVVFILAVLDRLGVRPLKMEHANLWFLSTIGNINWFCGYWSVVAWIPVISYWNREVRTDKRNKGYLICDGLLATLSLFTALIQGSDSGMLSMLVIILVLFCLSAENGDRMQRIFELLVMTCGACVLGFIGDKIWAGEEIYPGQIVTLAVRTILPWVAGFVLLIIYCCLRKQNLSGQFPKKIFVTLRKYLLGFITAAFVLYFVILLLNTILPSGLGPFAGKGLFTFDEMWAAQRGGTWRAAFITWWDQDLWHKLVGVGPDGMWEYISSGANVSLKEMVATQFPDQRLLNAHGEWITNLVNLGVLGAVSFAGFMVSFIRRGMKQGKKNAVFYLFALIVLSYTVNNIFSFQTTMNITHIFIMMGVGESLLRKEE